MRLILLFCLISFSGFADAAQISKVLEHDKYPHISIDGPIMKGDLKKILRLSKNFLDQGTQIELLINSSGGNLIEAIDIGRFVRDAYAQVKIRGDYIHSNSGKIRKCYSACVVIFVAAANRDHEMDNEYYDDQGRAIYVTEDGERVRKEVPTIGVHRPYFDKSEYGQLGPKDAMQKYKAVEALVKKFLIESGAPDAFLFRMFRTASNEIDLISKSEFMDMFPYEEPFLEEWFIAKCGAIEGSEYRDFITLSVKRAMTGGKKVVPKGMSEGYVDYLSSKYDEIQNCKSTTLLSHQRNVLEEYRSKFGD